MCRTYTIYTYSHARNQKFQTGGASSEFFSKFYYREQQKNEFNGVESLVENISNKKWLLDASGKKFLVL